MSIVQQSGGSGLIIIIRDYGYKTVTNSYKLVTVSGFLL